MKYLMALVLIVSFSVHGITKEESPDILKTQLKQANQNFTYDGKPIHPGCINEFSVSMADSGPPIVRAIDLKSCVSSNEFATNFKVGDDGYIEYQYEDSGDTNYFAYKYIGKAKGGLHILDTKWSGGGTMVARTVFLTRFGIEKYKTFNTEGNIDVENRLILKCIGQIVRGDRDIGSIELRDDKLILGDSQYRNKMEVISFD
ncbi:MAG: hypothetical protein AAF462_10330 [Thermodesulfobacteriota bacterium]